MVLRILESVVTSPYFPSNYVLHICIGLLSLYVLRVYSQGRKTDRERDLHARVVLVTGGFTSTGLTLLQVLAERGAHIIALTPEDIEDPNGRVAILVELLRTTTNNEKIFAEQCDLTSPASIRSFCTRFLTGQEQRLDAIIFAHELEHIGSPAFLSSTKHSINEEHRDAGSLATFLITTLLLPALLVAPVERDIRIINVVNPFYAAAAGLPFSPAFPSISGSSPDKQGSMLLSEGRRSLQSIILNRHFQRVLDALPTGAQVPKTEEGTSAVPVVSSKHQKSNIVAVTVCPGFSRVDTIAPLLNADWTSRHGFSKLGVFIYLTLHPFLRIFSKTPTSAIQTVLHALCLPTPFKVLSQTNINSKDKKEAPSPIDTSQLDMPIEVLRPGALYRECAMVKLNIQVSAELQQREQELKAERSKSKGKEKQKKDPKSSAPLQEEVLDIADDGEYGGELAGRLVWEKYEESLKTWEKNNPAPVTVEPKPEPPKPKDPNASPY
ncbi:hypothetical protein CVT24_001262 [Panaeolus cyanescens]|uniref:Ketoreductase (KR) domain-containing protein n=1 Tax=Panaeolus cyanescens TaxID=181874 RepID=A0A409YFY4_9AGAR|nr:hypothetical protein CVT24_001262 [Panaeolus cyanescens]